MYIKAGSVIVDYPVMQHVNEKLVEILDLNMYYVEGEEDTLLYEDEGESFDYMNDLFKEKRFILKGTVAGLDIFQDETGIYTESYHEYRVNLIGLPFKPTLATVDHEPVAFDPMPDNGYVLRVPKKFKHINVR